jgi:ABC-2 type transport system ATP-binding protein
MTRTAAKAHTSGPRQDLSGELAIEVQGLSKRFGRRDAVSALDMAVPTGVVAGFIGPNGAGKTTTLRMLLGLIRPTAGTGAVLGCSLADPRRYLARVGALIESPAFHPALTGRRNLEVLAALGAHPRTRVDAVLERVGLADRAEDPYRAYSLGMKQRLGIAAALLGDPALLVLDEPTNGLDPLGIRDMRELLRSLAASGPTLLVSSHLLAELEQVCDWIVALDHGRRVYQGPAADLLSTGREAVLVRPERATDVAALAAVATGAGFEAKPDGARLRLTGVIDDAAIAGLNRAAVASGIALVEIAPVRASLEDRYESLVTTKES